MKSAKQIVEHFVGQRDEIQREELAVWSELLAPLGLEVRDVTADLDEEGEIILYCRFPNTGVRRTPAAADRAMPNPPPSVPEWPTAISTPVAQVTTPTAAAPLTAPAVVSEPAPMTLPVWTPAPQPASVAPAAVTPVPPAPTPAPMPAPAVPMMPPMPKASPLPDLGAAMAAAERVLAEDPPAPSAESALDKMFSDDGLASLLDFAQPGMRTEVPSAPRTAAAAPVMFPSLPMPEAPKATPPAMPPIRLPIPEPAFGSGAGGPMPSVAPASPSTHVSSADVFEMPEGRLAEVRVTPAMPPKHVNPFLVRTESPEAQAERAARAIISDIVAYDREGHQRVVAMQDVVAIQQHFGHELDKAWRTFTTALGEKGVLDAIDPSTIQRIFAEQVNEVLGLGRDVLTLG